MTQEQNNTAIWESVQKTDPSGTKAGNVDGQVITSINGIYMAKRATETFGPIGKGWGYEIVEDRFDDTGPIFDKTSKEILCHGRTHTIRLRLWYMLDGEKYSVEHFGHTKQIYASKWGFTVDHEAPKKSLTDAMKKCLSQLGFCADIYMGMFDDQEYLNHQRNAEALEKAEDKIEEETKQEMEAKKHLKLTLKLVGESVNMNMLEGLYKTAARKLQLRGDKAGLIKLEKAKDEKLKELKDASAA